MIKEQPPTLTLTRKKKARGVRLTHHNFEEVARWCGGRVVVEKKDNHTTKLLMIQQMSFETSDNLYNVGSYGDWVIQEFGSYSIVSDQLVAFIYKEVDPNV